jgi:hypothetical protein
MHKEPHKAGGVPHRTPRREVTGGQEVVGSNPASPTMVISQEIDDSPDP